MTDVGPGGQQDYQIELDDEKLAAASDQPEAHVTMHERNYDGFTVTTLRSQLRNRKLSVEGAKPTLVARLKETDKSETDVGHSVMIQNIPPAQLDAVEASSAAGSANEEPTTVETTDDLSEITGAGTPGPLENVPPGGETTFGGEECNLLVVDVSAPPTGQGVTDEGDV